MKLSSLIPNLLGLVSLSFVSLGLWFGRTYDYAPSIGFFLGIIETMISAFGGSLYKDAVAFAILIIVLLLKPNGFFGKNVKEKV